MSGFAAVAVPATSANLGVGFDTLGIALDLEAKFAFLRAPELRIVGCEERFCGPDNLVWTSYLTACAALGKDPVPLQIDIQSPIPLSGGLGSSSACVVAGLMAAQLMFGRTYDPEFTLKLACGIEGHPDNVAPAVLGGLVSSFMDEGKAVTLPCPVASNLRFVVISPPYEVRTADARRVLPEQVPLATAVWQMGRCHAMVEGLRQGDAALIGRAAHDKLHEPYRAQLIADYEPLRKVALEAGACAFVISGSGSTMLAIADGAERAQDVHDALAAARPGMWLHILPAHLQGARVIDLA